MLLGFCYNYLVPKHGTSPRREQSARYYKKHKEKILAARRAGRLSGKTAKTTMARRAAMRYFTADLREKTPCSDCLNYYPSYVMDFDHVSGKKLCTVSQIIGSNLGWDALHEEIAKCEIVCSNCHRKRTHQRKVAATQKI